MMEEEMCECGDLPADDCMCDEFDLGREEDEPPGYVAQRNIDRVALSEREYFDKYGWPT